MYKVALTQEKKTFYKWIEEYTEGTRSLMLLDDNNYFATLLKDYQCQVVNNPSESTYKLSGEKNTLLYVLKDDLFFKFRIYTADILNADIRVVSNLEEIINELPSITHKYICLLVHPDIINHSYYNNIFKPIILNYNFSIITSKNSAYLSWLLIKQIIQLHARKHVTILPREKSTLESTDNHIIKTSKSENILDEISEVLKEGVDSFQVSSHGTEDVISLGDFIVCGKSSIDSSELMPCEVGVNCPVSNKGVIAQDIKSRIAILNICKGMRLNDTILPKNVNITYSFLENYSSAYISSNMVKYGPDAELCFIHNLLTVGHAISESVRILNNWLASNNFDFPSFYSIGDPKTRYNNKQEFINDYCFESNGDITLTCEGTICSIKLQNGFNPTKTQFYSKKKGVYYAVIYNMEEEEYYLYVYSWNKIGLIVISSFNSDSIDYSFGGIDSSEWINGLQRHVIGKKLPQNIQSIHNRMDKVAQLKEAAKYNLNSIYKLKIEKRKLDEEIELLQREVITNLLKRAETDTSIWLPDQYLDYASIEDKKCSVCPICNSSTRKIKFKHRVSGSSRHGVYCPKCGGISDSPSTSKISLQIDGHNSVSKNDVCYQKLIIKNLSGNEIDCVGGIRIDSVKQFGFKYSPEVSTLKLKPYEEISLDIEITLSEEVKPHLYYLKALIFADMSLYYFNKPLFIKG